MAPIRPEEEGAAGFERGPKWLTVKKSASLLTLQVEKSATATLQEHGTDKLSLAVIFGQARTGKSFLTNKLMGKPGLFSVRGGHEPTTVGADLSSFIPNTSVGAAGERKLGFVDVEGFGSEGDGYDVVLVAPLLLVSQVIIFNWMGKAAKHEMLKHLVTLAQAASMVRLERSAKKDDRIFGHLHIVLRDQASIEGVHKMLFEDEDATDSEAKDRNKTREIIRRSFASYCVCGLPPPIQAYDRLVAGDFVEADVMPAFDAKLTELKRIIMKQLAMPLALCGRNLSAMDVAELMPMLAAAVNDGQKDFVPQSLFNQLDQRQADSAAVAAIEAFSTREKTIREEMAMAPADLSDAIKAARQEGVELIKDRLVDVAEEKLEHALDRLSAHVNKSKEALVLANEKAIGLVVDDAKATAIKELDDLVEASEERQEPMDEETLEEEFGENTDAVLEDFDEAIAGLGDGEAVQRGRGEVSSKADASWKIIHRHNYRLVEQQNGRQADSAAVAAILAFSTWEEATRGEFPMAPADLSDAIKAARQEGVELIKDRLVDVAEEKLEHALDRLSAHVNKSKEALVLANEKAIGLVVDDAKATAIKNIDGLIADNEENQEPMEDETLVEKFGEDIDGVLEDFDEAVAGLDDAEAVQHSRDEVVSKADASWKIISRHNHRLVEQQNAREHQAEEDAVRAAVLLQAKESAARATARAAGAEDREQKADARAQEAVERAASSFYSNRRERLDSDFDREYASPESPIYYDGRLSSQPAGARNRNGSVSNGDGTTTDRNGRLHGSDGGFR